MSHMNALLERLRNSLTCHGQNVLPDHVLASNSALFGNMPDGCTQPALGEPWSEPDYANDPSLAIYNGFDQLGDIHFDILPTTIGWTTIETTTTTEATTTTVTTTTGKKMLPDRESNPGRRSENPES